jgi:glutamate dehydrogenase/leucine dehydrogenase
MFSHPDYDGHEAMLFAQDTASGLRALIAIHDTTLGPAFGGCRTYPYASFASRTIRANPEGRRGVKQSGKT